MSDYFTNAEDLGLWVKDRPTADDAAKELIGIMGKDKQVPEDDIVSTCRSIFNGNDQNASSVLFGILAQHNLTRLQKQAQSQSRQRNGWVRGMRNKWNRCVDGFNEGTPWRIDRDKMYDFTHYYTDAITFDEDPNRVYSGEAIWRSYIMDKYSREYQDKDGHWVGGYINDRFYVFPDAGTPANPKVARDGGNLLGLAPGERTRKPRPHQYSTERRLEEARGIKTTDLEATASSIKPIAKIASANLPKERHEDVVYNIFRDSIDMREAGFGYEDMIQKISEHYDVALTSVAQIDATAQRLVQKHSGVFYKLEKKAQDSSSLQGAEDELNDQRKMNEKEFNGKPILNPEDYFGENLYEIAFGSVVNTGLIGFDGYVYAFDESSAVDKVLDKFPELGIDDVSEYEEDSIAYGGNNGIPYDPADLRVLKLVRKASRKSNVKTAQYAPRNTFVVQSQLPVMSNGQEAFIQPETTVVALGGNKFEALNDPNLKQFEFVGQVPQTALRNLDAESGGEFPIQEAAEDLGLSETKNVNKPPMEANNGVEKGSMNDMGNQDANFEVTEQ